MCGIFGVIHLDKKPGKQSTSFVRRGIDLLQHRGPDDQGIMNQGPVCFGHRRLSIIDLAGGRQPMQRNNCLLTYNGEIYNYQELRQELANFGKAFTTHSDTEVLLQAYEKWGSQCLQRLNGMFAFAAFNPAKEECLLARDRLGIKPLFYTQTASSIIFSSELEPLYQSLGQLKLNLEALNDYLTWQYIHAPQTIYKNVYALPPGHFLAINLKSGQIRLEKYWQLQFTENHSLSYAQWKENIATELNDAVKRRLRADVNFGAFLSGGIDSTLILKNMSAAEKRPIAAYTIGFAEADYNEIPFASKAAEKNRAILKSKIVGPDIWQSLNDLMLRFGQPFADSSALVTAAVAAEAAKEVKMVLAGDGADENFAGYSSYSNILEQWPPQLPQFSVRALARYFYNVFNYFRYSSIDRLSILHTNTAVHFSQNEKKNLYRDQYSYLAEHNFEFRKKYLRIEKQATISRLQNLDLHCYLPYDILTKVDICSMAHSLEVRVPFLDHKLVELTATMPTNYKLAKKNSTYIKKAILKDLLRYEYENAFIERRKQGFGVPLKEWFANSLNSKIKAQLKSSDTLPLFFDMSYLKKLFDNHGLSHDNSTRIYNILALESFLQNHKSCL